MQVTKKVFRLTPVFLSLSLSLSTVCADNLATKTTASTGTSSSTSSTSPAPSSTVSTGSIVGATVGGTVVAGGAIGGGVALNKAIDANSGLVNTWTDKIADKIKGIFNKKDGENTGDSTKGEDSTSVGDTDGTVTISNPNFDPENPWGTPTEKDIVSDKTTEDGASDGDALSGSKVTPPSTSTPGLDQSGNVSLNNTKFDYFNEEDYKARAQAANDYTNKEGEPSSQTPEPNIASGNGTADPTPEASSSAGKPDITAVPEAPKAITVSRTRVALDQDPDPESGVFQQTVQKPNRSSNNSKETQSGEDDKPQPQASNESPKEKSALQEGENDSSDPNSTEVPENPSTDDSSINLNLNSLLKENHFSQYGVDSSANAVGDQTQVSTKPFSFLQNDTSLSSSGAASGSASGSESGSASDFDSSLEWLEEWGAL